MASQSPKFQITKAWPNIRKMLQHRGYQVIHMPESVEPSYVTKSLAKSDYRIILSHKEQPNKKLVVQFRIEEKTGVKAVRNLVEWMKKNAIYQAIIFSPSGATAFTAKAVEDYQPTYSIEIRCYKRFFFCLVEHDAIPKHRILSPEEKEYVLQTLQTEEKYMPLQLSTDSITEYYGLKKGDMICYWVNTGSQEFSKYYRIVT